MNCGKSGPMFLFIAIAITVAITVAIVAGISAATIAIVAVLVAAIIAALESKEMQGAEDRRQGIAQLMGKHRQELVLALVKFC